MKLARHGSLPVPCSLLHFRRCEGDEMSKATYFLGTRSGEGAVPGEYLVEAQTLKS